MKIKNYLFRFNITAFLIFLIIMVPNIIWFLIPASNDVLRNESVTPVVDAIGSVFQVIMIAGMCFLKRKNVDCPETEKTQTEQYEEEVAAADEKKVLPHKKIHFPTLFCIEAYYACWIFYYLGHVDIFILFLMAILPCLAFILYIIKEKNYAALIPAAGFTICHVIFAVVNFII